jgi:hypothetical protein
MIFLHHNLNPPAASCGRIFEAILFDFNPWLTPAPNLIGGRY